MLCYRKIELITSYYNSDSGSGEEIIDETPLSKSQNNVKSKKVKTKKDGKKPKDINISSMTQPYGPELPERFKKSETKAPSVPNLNVKVNTSDDILKEQKCDAILDKGEGIKNNDLNTIKNQLLNDTDNAMSVKSDDTVIDELQVLNSISSPLEKNEDIVKNDVSYLFIFYFVIKMNINDEKCILIFHFERMILYVHGMMAEVFNLRCQYLCIL